MNILVVQNSQAICQRLLALLTESGRYSARGCVTCIAAVMELVKACHPDALVLDLRLPDGSGFKVIEQLRSQHQDLPVILLADSNNTRYALHAQTLGATTLLSKLTQFDEIIPTLDRLLGIPEARS